MPSLIFEVEAALEYLSEVDALDPAGSLDFKRASAFIKHMSSVNA
jgi:hypothetical protein